VRCRHLRMPKAFGSTDCRSGGARQAHRKRPLLGVTGSVFQLRPRNRRTAALGSGRSNLATARRRCGGRGGTAAAAGARGGARRARRRVWLTIVAHGRRAVALTRSPPGKCNG
jgi:hypothetical protein